MTALVEGSTRDVHGGVVVRSRLRAGTARQGFERMLFPSVEVGLAGWQRAHSQGAGLGTESPHAIRYAPAEVNQQYQRLGIERFLRDLLAATPADTELWLTTVTRAHPRTLRLKDIQYRVDAVRGGRQRRLFEAGIEVADSRDRPLVRAWATPCATEI